MQVHFLFLLPMAFLLLSGTWAGQIIGGWEAKPHSRPYMAFLEIQRTDDIINCGGFLVAENFVLTAAHCQGEEITVTLGAHDVSEEEDSQQVIPVRRQIPHPQYNKNTYENDIMLLQLSKRAELNGWVDTIVLPCAKEKVEPGTVCSVAGWGNMEAEQKAPPTTALQETNVVVMKDESCPRKRGGLYRNFHPSTMMCVGDPKEKNDSALGDSGGPLVCGKKAQGIVSWGSEKGPPPGVYTRVSAFIPWIKKQMKKLKP